MHTDRHTNSHAGAHSLLIKFFAAFGHVNNPFPKTVVSWTDRFFGTLLPLAFALTFSGVEQRGETCPIKLIANLAIQPSLAARISDKRTDDHAIKDSST